MKKNLRIIIDIIMFILFIILMGYHITGNKAHEILGVITFVFFILHHIVNIKWYKTLFKGKYNFYRVFQIIIDTFLFVAMIGIIVSSIIISSNVFSFFNIKTTMFARNLHMISTSWAFVLMAIHLGLHLNIMLSKFTKKMKNSTFEYVYYLIMALFIIFGIYSFIDNELFKDMFLVNKFKFFDYQESPYIYYLKTLFIILSISLITYIILKIVKRSSKW